MLLNLTQRPFNEQYSEAVSPFVRRSQAEKALRQTDRQRDVRQVHTPIRVILHQLLAPADSSLAGENPSALDTAMSSYLSLAVLNTQDILKVYLNDVTAPRVWGGG